MSDPALRAALFRFVDVRPACATPPTSPATCTSCSPTRDDSGHARRAAEHHRPQARHPPRRRDRRHRRQADGAALHRRRRRQGLAADDHRRCGSNGVDATVDLLGEATVSEAEADRYAQRCEDALRTLAAAATKYPSRRRQPVASRSPRSRRCCAPRRPSAGSRAPGRACATCCASPATSAPTCTSTWSPSTRARRSPALTLDLLSRARVRRTARPPASSCRPTSSTRPSTSSELLDWAREHPRAHPFTIRLVKGAYWDHEVVQAAQHGWTPPVFTDRRECDRNFELLTKRLIDATPTVRVAIASPQPALDLRRRRLRRRPRRRQRPTSSSRSCAGWATTRRPRSPPPAAACAPTARSATSSPAWPTSCAACSRTPPTTPSSPPHASGTDTAELLEAP